MRRSNLKLPGAVLLLAFASTVIGDDAVPDRPSFNRDIRPIMSDTCFKCHGPAAQEAGLRLDRAADAFAKSESGATPIVPGKPDASEVVRRIFSDDNDELMPPPDSHKTLTDVQKQTMRRWIENGAEYEQHWSFVKPVRPALPEAKRLKDGHNAIDAFIDRKLAEEGLAMSGSADRPALIRRIAFALTGLPPTPADVDNFVNDASDKAYENMVDGYLASPHFGEEMARHWLDVARYGDTHGMHLDNERQMWAFRDWVIAAFNDNMPFDEFAVQQLAGDLLADATNEQLTGTGFLRCNITTGEGGSINEEWLFRNAVERTSTTSQVFMGLTAGCAVCHDHKFDPISAKEYYSLYAFFNSAADPALDGNRLLTAPTIKLQQPTHTEQIQSLTKQIATKEIELKEAVAALAYVDPASVEPRPAIERFAVELFDDAIPSGSNITASPSHPPNFVTAENGRVFSGRKALKRTHNGLTQDVVQAVPNVKVPANGRIYVHVYIEADDVPKSLMIQFHTTGWLHRAVWGDYDAIDWGAKGTPQRVHMGDLPKTGEWVKLEVDAATLGLASGQEVNGYAFTQVGGTVFWDQAGFEGESDPVTDPARSLLAWWKQQTGKDTPGVPKDINAVLKAGPDAKLTDAQKRQLRDYFVQNICVDTKAELGPLAAAITDLKKQKTDVEAAVPGTFVYRDLPQPRESFVMLRGEYNKPGDKVQPNTPAVLPPLNAAANGQANRLDLARWLVSADHPLTSRVQVNRLWQQFFGIGLVATPDDFGSQGEVPSHPQLLDWLATDFQQSGWDTKRLVKLMLMSHTFQQSSAVTQEVLARDPANRFYARGPRFRLGAEQIRDNALFVSGLLNQQMGGRGVRPYQPPNIWEPVGFVGSNTANYKQDSGDALYRRSIYVFLKRTAPPPFMSNFDAPSREAVCSRRERSNSPLQALQLLNDVQQVEAARSLAERILKEGGADASQRCRFAFRTVLAREPEADEAAVVQQTLARHLEDYRTRPEAAAKLIANGDSKPDQNLDAAELAAWTMIGNLMLNLDETLNRN